MIGLTFGMWVYSLIPEAKIVTIILLIFLIGAVKGEEMWDLTPGGQHGSVLRMGHRQQYSHYASPQNNRVSSAPRVISIYRREVRNTKKTNDSCSKQLNAPFQTMGAKLCSSVNAGSNAVRSDVHRAADGTVSSISSTPSFCRPSPPPKTVCLVQHSFPCTSPTCAHFLLHWLTPQEASTHAHTHSLFFSPWTRKKKDSGCRCYATHLYWTPGR
jgi:hypothetical protein